jgi:GTPase
MSASTSQLPEKKKLQGDLQDDPQDDLPESVTGGAGEDTLYLPLIAVVGRPNVGKSTLFNRLIRKRRSITDPTPGVTRDPVEHEWQIDGQRLLLVDTGGFKAGGDSMDELVSSKSISYLERAEAILLITDVTDLTPEDETFIELLRPYSDKLLLLVNKVDNPKREQDVWDYYSLGLGEPIPISAAHGIGIDLLEEALMARLEESGAFERSAAYSQGESEDVPIRLAVLGKPNTGKSTLTNHLIGRDVSIVSDIPGTTRDVIESSFSWKDTHYTILDTAGIRRKKKVGENIEYYSVNRAFSAIEEADLVLLMIDAQEGLSDQDKKITSQIIKRGKGVLLVLNKWDMVKEMPNMMQAIEDRVRFLFPVLDFAPLIPISAKTGEGLEKLISTVFAVYRQLRRRVDTGAFNAKLKEWGERYQPPRGKRGHYKVLYGTQVGIEPPRFLLFVNRKSGFPVAYVSYLTNNIRKELGFQRVPLRIDLKERRRN